MSSHFVFCFLFLFSYFLLLLSAVPECVFEKASCGYLGEISYPFTTNINNTECGFHITGCEQEYSSGKTINLRKQTINIDSISSTNDSIIIYSPRSYEFKLKSIQNMSKFSINTITFFGCNHNYDNSHEKKIRYRHCSNYDIYFTSKHDHPIPMFPIFQIPCLQVVNKLSQGPSCDCVELISLLEIKVEVDFKHCEVCNFEGSSCVHNQENFDLRCGPGKYIISY